ncbi:MAG: T9SS type A sorting domain-containing protein [Calditrichales bacterium]|nr:MAG: T9SS type A sorting domain-containing protein [Calditrichales bacterium]
MIFIRAILPILMFIQLLPYTSHAQITISRSDFENLAAPDLQNYSYAVLSDSTLSVDIGGTGGSNVYDFSAWQFTAVDTAVTMPVGRVSQLESRYPAEAISMRSYEDVGGDHSRVETTVFQRSLSSGIFGTWENTTSGDDLLILSFFEDGTYLHAEYGENDPAEENGMEWGRFTLNESSGRVTFAQFFDNNAGSGLSDILASSPPFLYMHVSADDLKLRIDEDGNGSIDDSVQFNRLESSGIWGTWKNSTSANDLLLISFFADGTYLHAEVDSSDHNEISGMEWGLYTRNESDGLVTGVSQLFDNNGDTGLTGATGPGAPFLYINAAGDELSITSNEISYYYDVYLMQDDGLHIIGDASISPQSERHAKFSPAELYVPFPLNYGYSTSFSFTRTDSMHMDGMNMHITVDLINITKEADGWGTLILPGFGSFECLRWREVSEESEESKVFTYFTREGYFLQVITDFTEPNSGVISARSLFFSAPQLASRIEDRQAVTGEFTLMYNYPNPFNPTTTIAYHLPAFAYVELKIYDMLGKEINTLINEKQAAGNKSVRWDGKDNSGKTVSSGAYIYRLQIGDQVQTRKMMLLK